MRDKEKSGTRLAPASAEAGWSPHLAGLSSALSASSAVKPYPKSVVLRPMSARKRLSLALLTSVFATTAFAQSSPRDRAFPPGVQKVSNQSPALSPAEALQTFYLPPGY